MFSEDDLLPISALQHLLFCERQCALIHLERLWSENRLTIEGRHLHEKAHAGPDETRRAAGGPVRIVHGLPLRSLRLGLAGIADVVEFHFRHASAGPAEPTPDGHSRGPNGEDRTDEGVDDAAARGPPVPFPVEYKRGRPKRADCDRVQLCAQALCLEEMLHVSVPAGALFYGRTRRRVPVAMDAALRRQTEQAAARLRTLLAAGVTPCVPEHPGCRNCSLRGQCLPDLTGRRRSAADYLRRTLRALAAGDLREEAPP